MEPERARTGAAATAKKLRASKRGQEPAQGGTRGSSRKIIACFAGRRVKYCAQIFLADAEEFISTLHLPPARRTRNSVPRVCRQINAGRPDPSFYLHKVHKT